MVSINAMAQKGKKYRFFFNLFTIVWAYSKFDHENISSQKSVKNIQ